MSTTYVTMPDTGQQVEMSNPPVYTMKDHAWLTREQVEFQCQGLAVMLHEGVIQPALGTGPDEGTMGFVLTENPDRAVFVVNRDGSCLSALPLPAEFEAWKNRNADTAVKDGTLSEEEAVKVLSAEMTEHEGHPEPATCDTGFYL